MLNFAPLWRYREAIRLLTLRELRVRYSNSALGVVWSLIAPLAMTVIFTIVFGVISRNPMPAYPVFFLAGLLPWNFFSLSLTASTQSVTGNSNLVKRVYFPREILPLSIVCANGINYLVALIPLAILMAIYGVGFTPALLWMIPILAIQIVLSTGLGLALAALNANFRDVQQIVDILILPLFFATPIFYDVSLVENVVLKQVLILGNPMASLVTAYRAAIYSGATPDLSILAITAVETVVIFGIGWVVFRKLSDAFVDEI